jgi:hypothetical protein
MDFGAIKLSDLWIYWILGPTEPAQPTAAPSTPQVMSVLMEQEHLLVLLNTHRHLLETVGRVKAGGSLFFLCGHRPPLHLHLQTSLE